MSQLRNILVEYGTPLEKSKPPLNEDNLRIGSITAKISMQFETFMIRWLWDYIEPHFNCDQFGGQKGNSVSN